MPAKGYMVPCGFTVALSCRLPLSEGVNHVLHTPHYLHHVFTHVNPKFCPMGVSGNGGALLDLPLDFQERAWKEMDGSLSSPILVVSTRFHFTHALDALI